MAGPCTNSASAPANSTPVGPPPTITNVRSRRRRSGSGSSVAELHTRRAASDDNEREESAAPLRVRLVRGRFEAGQNVLAERNCVVHPAQEESVLRRTRDPEVVGLASEREYQPVVGDALGRSLYRACCKVDPAYFGHAEPHVGSLAQDRAHWVRDVARRQLGRGDLVQERKKGVVVVAVDE